MDTIINQLKGKKFGELVLDHIKNQTSEEINSKLFITLNNLPAWLKNNEIEILIDHLNSKAYEKTFWRTDSGDQFAHIIKITKDRFSNIDYPLSNEDYLNVFNVIVLNFSFGASIQKEMRRFIKNSISNNFFSNLFRKKDISEGYRWSIVFKKDGIPQYEMLGDNVCQMLGYYLIPFAEKGNPKEPWDLFLRFNKNGKDIKLTKIYFSNSNTITNELYKNIKSIDMDYQVTRFKEEIFIDRITGRKIKIKSISELHNDMHLDIESLSNGTYEDRQRKKESELTFFKVLNEIFN